MFLLLQYTAFIKYCLFVCCQALVHFVSVCLKVREWTQTDTKTLFTTPTHRQITILVLNDRYGQNKNFYSISMALIIVYVLLSSFCLFVCPYVCSSFCWYVCQAVLNSVCLSFCKSVCLSSCHSFCLIVKTNIYIEMKM